ncbi:switch 2 isoform X2 [Magnolia sinica]|nr:switch 2 isoform X2 [Magnolia sinica]
MVKRDLVGKKGPVLIVCPTSVIHNWENEFSEWGTLNVAVYHGPNRDLILEKLEACSVMILITSFDTFRIHDEILSEIQWDIVIVDEAHRLKNEKSKLYRACLRIKTPKRFGLTGTIMQNKMMELFNLFDWVAPGCLGTREHFRDFYDEPLKHGQRSSAPERFVQIADKRKRHLVEVLRMYLLRRTKEETIGHLMMGKEDNVVFCAMSELQKRVYRRTLGLPDIQCLINKDLPCSCGSPLTQAECCNRTVPNGIIWPYLHRDNPEGCDSCPFCVVLPCLVKLQQISNHLELIKPNPKDDIEKQRKDAEFASAVFDTDIDLVGGNTQSESFMDLSKVEHCGKMRALEKLMLSWVSKGDKILLFSFSVRMLDILEKFLIRKGYCFSRLDGATPMSSRQTLVDEFNSSPSKQVFLISTRAGGLGLNLVSANRVVIFDPNWNPAQDLQAQDRSFRYGQKRHVIVFRLLAAGSIEELVYSRQIYKQQLSNIAVSGKMEKRYFEGVQDCKQFQGELFGICNLFRDLSDKLFTGEIIELHEKRGLECRDSHGTKEDSTEHGTNPINKNFLISHKFVDYPFPEKANGAFLSGSEDRKSGDAFMDKKDQPVLEEMGIIYAHRNEDIVNTRPGFPAKKDASSREINDSIMTKELSSNNIPMKRPVNKDASVCKSDNGMVTVQSSRNKNLTKMQASKDARLVGNNDNILTKQSGSKNVSGEEASSVKRKKSSEFGLLAQFMGMEKMEFSKWLLSASYSQREKVLHDYKSKKS